MAKIRHLSRAPISEAVIELRVRPRNGFAFDELQHLAQRWKHEYPVEQKVQSMAATFGLYAGRPMTQDARFEQLGFLLKSKDLLSVVQFQTGLFAFSRLHPYTSWEEVLPLAQEAWSAYCESIRPERLVRLGVRYVNRLRLRLPVDLAAHLTSTPVLPKTLPSDLRGYLTRTILHDSGSGNSVTLTQAIEPATEQGNLVILLDVDAFRDVDMEPADDRIVDILDSLRHLKNRAFFESITEATAEMYE